MLHSFNGEHSKAREVKKSALWSSSQIWKCEEWGQEGRIWVRNINQMSKGALAAHNTGCFAAHNMNLQFRDGSNVGCTVEGMGLGACTQIRERTGEVLKNAQAFDFTFILQKVNQYLLTPMHLYRMAFCYGVTRAWICLFWTENSLIQRDFSTWHLKHCFTSCHKVTGLNPVFYCTTLEPEDRNY